MSPTIIPIFVVAMILITTLPVFFIMRRVFGGMKRQSAEHQRLLQVGIPAPAQIQSVQMGGMTMTTGVHRHLQLVISLHVQAPGRPPYMAQLTAMVSELQVPQLQPGAMVQVRIDPANPAKLALEAVGQPMGHPGMPNPAMGHPGMPQPGMPQPGMPNPAMAGVPRMQYGAGVPAAPAGMTPVQPVQMPAGAKVGLFIGIGAAVLALGVGVAVPLLTMSSSSPDLPAVPVPTPNGSASSVCAKAVTCCETISPGSAAHCKNMSMPGVTDAVCQSSLEGFRRAAEAQGKTCD